MPTKRFKREKFTAWFAVYFFQDQRRFQDHSINKFHTILVAYLAVYNILLWVKEIKLSHCPHISKGVIFSILLSSNVEVYSSDLWKYKLALIWHFI